MDWSDGEVRFKTSVDVEKLSEDVGEVLMTNLVREFGDRKPVDSDEDLHLMALLMTMARLYTRAAGKVWPVRPLEFLEELQASLAHREAKKTADA